MNLNYWCSGTPASMEDILDAREERAAVQKQMLSKHPCCLVCFTLNIPGPVKTFPFTRWLYEVGKAELINITQYLTWTGKNNSARTFLEIREIRENTGEEGFFALSLDPLKMKSSLTKLEEAHPLGRLFDFDVLRPDGSKVSRRELGYSQRTCLLCGDPAFVCGRSRRHSARELITREISMMETFFEERMSRHLGLIMQKALFYEVNTFLKPGLVDKIHNGAHKDMCADTFVKSAYALTPYFTESARMGLSWKGEFQDLPQLFSRLRERGRQAEKEMFSATGGVNTHKGIIFSGGIFCCALGYLISEHGLLTSRFIIDDFSLLPDIIKKMLDNLMKDYVSLEACRSEPKNCTHGEQLYRSYRLGGIRREAAGGFPAVFEKGLPLFSTLLHKGYSLNQSGCLTLLSYISFLEDTNLFIRAGYQKARNIQQELTSFLSSSSPKEQLRMLPSLDRYFTEQHISPGGSADMLALTYFLYFLTEKPCCFS